MNDTSLSPAPLVEHALQGLRDKTPSAAAQHQAPLAPGALTEPPVAPDALTEPPDEVTPATLVGSAMEALRTVSVSAQTRLANPDAFPELPPGRDLPDLGPFVELVMREAQAAAAAYREEAARETAARATELLAAAAASADTIRREADAYGEQTRAAADALLAQRVRLIADLTGRLAQMAQLAGDQLGADQKLRDQMMAFISALTAAAQETVTEVFPNTTLSSRGPGTDPVAAQPQERP